MRAEAQQYIDRIDAALALLPPRARGGGVVACVESFDSPCSSRDDSELNCVS